MYKRLLLIFVTAILFIFVISTVVLADQLGSFRYCNQDQYGCWVTEEDGRRSYIMFWSEEIKNNFIGKDKQAVICNPPDSHGGEMKLEKAPKHAVPKPNPVPPEPDPTPYPEPEEE